MRWASFLLAGLACAALSDRAAAVTLTFELDLLEGDYTFVPEEKNQTIVFPAAQAFRAISFTLVLEGQSTCSAACDPPSSFLFRLGTGTFLNIGPFEGPLDLTLPIAPFRPLFFAAGEPLPLALSLGRYPDPPGLLVPVPSAPASVTRAEIRFTGDLIAVPEPRAAALLLPGLAATIFAARLTENYRLRFRRPGAARSAGDVGGP